MASGLGDAARPPRRFDLAMSRRTRRPPSLATNRNREDPALEGFQQPQQQNQDANLKEQTPPQCLCLSDHLQSEEDRQEHTDECEAQQQQECEADNSRRFSLQELIQDEAIDSVKDVATGSPLEESNAEAATAAVHEGEAAAAAACAEKHRPEQVAERRVIRIVRRYAKVRSIKPKPAPEKNLAPVRMLRMLNN